tara:strand:+ start:28279 stop:29100 length:822 start_codon:yes stop_codon:yes gene_type:complete
MLRVGAVSYLNTKPLIYGLRERMGGAGRLQLNLPSRLAEDLSAGKLDVALIPSVEYFRGPRQNRHDGYKIVSDAVIACRGPVWSVRLLSRVPVPQIKRLALDEGSRTSAAMLKVLLHEIHSLSPETIPLGIEQTPDTVDADAILLIGDRAMHPERGVYQEIWDLGDRWCRWTEKPFVFAMWVARRGLDTDELAEMLQASRDDGLANLDRISAEEAAGHGLTNEDLLSYFVDNLHFQLGPGERLGLETFRQRAASLGLIPPHQDVSTHSLSNLT